VYAIGGGLASAAPPNLVIAAVPVHLQAVNTVGVIGTLGSTAAMQVGFAILLGHIVTVVQGSPIYGETGVVTVYLLAAGLASWVSSRPWPCGTASTSVEAAV
jgi:hypothetical protein